MSVSVYNFSSDICPPPLSKASILVCKSLNLFMICYLFSISLFGIFLLLTYFLNISLISDSCPATSLILSLISPLNLKTSALRPCFSFFSSLSYCYFLTECKLPKTVLFNLKKSSLLTSSSSSKLIKNLLQLETFLRRSA